jgi:hypothetical protein
MFLLASGAVLSDQLFNCHTTYCGLQRCIGFAINVASREKWPGFFRRKWAAYHNGRLSALKEDALDRQHPIHPLRRGHYSDAPCDHLGLRL